MWTATWDAQRKGKKTKTKVQKKENKVCEYFFEFIFVFCYFFSSAAVYTKRISRYWRDTSLAAQFLIGCLLPSVQQQQENTAPFHTEQT